MKLRPTGFYQDMPSPTGKEFNDPLFDAIYDTIKNWDVNVPEYYSGYCGASGSHAVLILRAIREVILTEKLAEL